MKFNQFYKELRNNVKNKFIYQEYSIIFIVIKIIIIQCNIQIHQWILEKTNYLNNKKLSSVNNFSFIHLPNSNSINSNMTNIQILCDISLFTIDNIIFMILNFINY